MRIVYLLIILAHLSSYAHAQSHDSVHTIVLDKSSFQPPSAGPLRFPAGEKSGGIQIRSPVGDTYNGTPFLGDASAFYSMLSPSPSTHTFDNVPESAGINQSGAPGDRIEVNEFLVVSGDLITVKTSWLNLNSSGNAATLVGPGVGGPNGPFSTFRLALGTNPANPANPIDVPNYGYVADTGRARFINILGAEVDVALGGVPPAGSSTLYADTSVSSNTGNVADLNLVAAEYRWTMKRLPLVTAVTPNSGPIGGGQSVVITGNYFEANATVRFGAVPCTNIVVTVPTSIACTTPANAAGLVNVTVTNSGTYSGTGVNLYQYLPPPPTVTSVTPASGPAAGGAFVFVSGTGFIVGASVTFGGAPCTNVNVGLPTLLSCTTPPGTGLVNVVVTNPGGQSGTLVNGYRYLGPAPTLTGVTKNFGPGAGGTTVVIGGSAFQVGASVTFGAAPCTNIFVATPTLIECTTPPGTGVVNVVVTNPDGQSGTLFNGYTYLGPAPTVTSVAPASGPQAGGATVSVIGSGFVVASSVRFGFSPCTNVNFVSPTVLTCTTPPGTGLVEGIVVTNPDGQSGFLINGYTYVGPAPTVTSVTPNSGPAAGGTPVTISGSGFQAGAVARFGDALCTNAVVTVPNTITCNTPFASPVAVNVTVTNPDGQSAVLVNGYTYIATPSLGINSITPTSGPAAGGTSVTIGGTGFQAGTTARFGATPCTSVVVTVPNTITCNTPSGAPGSVDVTVTNPGGQSAIFVQGYRYIAAPTVTNVTPASGPAAGGAFVLVSGSGFVSGTSVTIGGAPCTNVNVGLPSALSCTTPPGTGLVNVVVTNPGGQSGTLVNGYTYLGPAPTLSSVTPNSGPAAGGSRVTISGNHFQAGASALFGDALCTNAVVTVPNTITCDTPFASPVAVNVTVTNPDGQSAGLVNGYTYVANLLFADGFEAATVAAAAGSYRLPSAALLSVLDDAASLVYVLHDAHGEAARIYARVSAGQLQYAITQRGSIGLLPQGPWISYSAEPQLRWTASEQTRGWVVQSVNLQ